MSVSMELWCNTDPEGKPVLPLLFGLRCNDHFMLLGDYSCKEGALAIDESHKTPKELYIYKDR
jgi:hypothetical protein